MNWIKKLLLVACTVLFVWMAARLFDDPAEATDEAPDVDLERVLPFADQHARVVWVRQIVGNGDDPFVLGSNFVLMGLDNRDGRGERVILSDKGNYCRPMLTPDGERIVYSNREDGHVHLVGFDGSGQASVVQGFAVDVWRDPATGRDWLYYLLNVRQVETSDGGPLMRCLLAKPETGEVVWDRSPVTTDNVQLSADGKRAAGLFPWSRAGVLDLTTGKMSKMGKGCWTSMAPDNSYMMWIFDGAHKNLLLKLPGATFSRKVRLNQAPGIGGYEVYHPRWSNHVRFMAMTGPYKIMGKHNAIQGGGEGINVVVGQFNEEFSHIETWTQITDAKEADFFPDVWLEGGQDAESTLKDSAVTAKDVRPDVWPSRHQGVVYFWENAKRDNQIDDGERQRTCGVARRGWATFGRDFDAELTRGALLAQDGGEWLLEDVSVGFSVEFIAGPATGDRPNPGAIIANAVDSTNGNFVLLERNRNVFFKLRTSEVSFENAVEQPIATLSPTYHNHIVVTYEKGVLSWYVNGEPAMMTSDIQGDLNVWEQVPLVFGQMGDSTWDWPGRLACVAIYSRPLLPEEVAAHFKYTYDQIMARNHVPEIRVKATLTHITQTPTPASIKPYRAGLVEYSYRIDEVLSGPLEDEEVIVQHWGILDGREVPKTTELNGQYVMVLQHLADHPEMEGERISSTVEDPTLETFLEMEWKTAN